MKKALNIIFKAAPFVSLAVLAIYLTVHFIGLFDKTALVAVTRETLAETVDLDGFIFRDETVLTAGEIKEIYYSDGEKIPVGAIVANDGEDVISECSGYFYTQVDGYETLFTSSAALALTVENYEKVTTANPFDDSKNAKPQAPGAFGKVATDFVWYFAAKTADAEKFEAGKQYDATIGGVGVTLTLVKTSADGKSAVLIFECDEVPRGKFFKRATAATVTVAYHSGTAVPSEAIHDINKLKYIYIFDDGYARRRAVDLVFEKNGAAIIRRNDLGEGDLVIVGKGLYDGKVMH